MTIDHETCSERLRPYVRDELPRSARAEVEEHLAGCAECSAEEVSVRALEAAEVEPMTDLERGRLHRALRENLVVPQGPARSPFTWVPGALAVAAVLLAIVVGIRVLPGAGGDDEADSGGGAEMSAPLQPETYSLRDGLIVGNATTDRSRASEGAPLEGAPDATTDIGVPDDREGSDDEMLQENLFDVDKRRLGRVAERGRILQPFAGAYTASEVPTLREGFLDVLVSDAPDPAVGRQILDCDALLSGSQERPMLPVIAAHGRFEGRAALLLAYLTPADGDALTRSAFFVWPRGDCSIPLFTQFGEVP